MFRRHWPTSAAVYLPNDEVPETGTLFTNTTLAETYARILREANIELGPLANEADELRQHGAAAIFIAVDGAAAGVLAISDPIKSTTPGAVAARTVRVENNLGAAHGRPTHRFRIAKRLVTDRDAEGNTAHREHAPRAAGLEVRLFLDRNLVLGLVAEHLPRAGDHERDVLEPGVRPPFHRHDDGDAVSRRGRADGFEPHRLLSLVGRGDVEVLPAHAGQIAFGKADEVHLPLRRLGEKRSGAAHGV